jgi:hypothetical protein
MPLKVDLLQVRQNNSAAGTDPLRRRGRLMLH